MCTRFLVGAQSENMNIQTCVGVCKNISTDLMELRCTYRWGEKVWKTFSRSHWKTINQIFYAQESPMRTVWGVRRPTLFNWSQEWRNHLPDGRRRSLCHHCWEQSFCLCCQNWLKNPLHRELLSEHSDLKSQRGSCLTRLILEGKKSPSGTPLRATWGKTRCNQKLDDCIPQHAGSTATVHTGSLLMIQTSVSSR